MYTRLSCLLLLAVAVSPTRAQEDKLVGVVKSQVKKMVDATVGGKYDVVIELTHPKIVEMLGGREKAVQQIKTGMEAIKARGFTFKVTGIGTPEVAKGKKDHYAVGTYTLVMTGLGKKITSNAVVAGVSTDGGKTWKFVEAQSEEIVKKLMPDFPAGLKIPKRGQKVEEVQ